MSVPGTSSPWFWWIMGIAGAVVAGVIVLGVERNTGDEPPRATNVQQNAGEQASESLRVSISGPTEWGFGAGFFTLTGTVSGQAQSVFWTDGLGVNAPWNGGRLDLICPAPGVYTVALTAVGLDSEDHRARHTITCR